MTIQTNDYILYNDKKYVLSSIEHPSEFFDIKSLGLKPVAIHTACWRGYDAVFAVKDNKLVLHDLETNGGKKIDYDDYDALIPENAPAINNKYPKVYYKHGLANYEYEDVGLPLNYTGAIVITESAFVLGYFSSYDYKDVYRYIENGITLTFKNGVLKKDSRFVLPINWITNRLRYCVRFVSRRWELFLYDIDTWRYYRNKEKLKSAESKKRNENKKRNRKNKKQKRGSPKTTLEMIESLIAREHEVPKYGKDFEVVEKLIYIGDEFGYGEFVPDNFTLTISPSHKDPNTLRVLSGRIANDNTYGGGFISTNIKAGTKKEIFDFLKSPEAINKVNGATVPLW